MTNYGKKQRNFVRNLVKKVGITDATSNLHHFLKNLSMFIFSSFASKEKRSTSKTLVPSFLFLFLRRKRKTRDKNERVIRNYVSEPSFYHFQQTILKRRENEQYLHYICRKAFFLILQTFVERVYSPHNVFEHRKR